MGDVLAEHARALGSFGQPTLRLLHANTAPAIVAVLRACFEDTAGHVDATWLEQAVTNHLDTLRAAGLDNVPSGTGRDLCRAWMRRSWLVRSLDEDREVYALTSHAQSALELVRSVSSERTGLSEHRVATIMQAARRFNAGANPDVAERVRIVDQQIADLQENRRRLTAGEEVPAVTEDYLLEGYSELTDLIASLPRDFARVQESFATARADLMGRFREEDAVPGQIVADYITRVDSIMTATPEGRAFEGALALLRNEDHKDQLRSDLRALANHPQAHDILTPADRTQLTATMGVLNDGIQSVLTMRRRVSTALRDYLTSHDVAEERELDRVLRDLGAAFPGWLERTGPRTTSCLQLPQRCDVSTLPTRFWDPARGAAPDRLETDVADPNAAPTLAELAAGGGPSYDKLRVAIDDARGRRPTLAVVFNDLDPALRRPVELTGLLHLATNDPGLAIDDGTVDVYETVRHDGTPRALAGPRVTIAPEETP